MSKNSETTLLFYQGTAVKTLINGEHSTTLLGTAGQPLAECQSASQRADKKLLATDQQGSVVNVASEAGLPSLSYTPYGFSTPEHRSHSVLGYNGERPDVFALYLLGNYRNQNTVIMRFHSPDSVSPFGEGGINAYGYCLGDPINNTDPSGHWVFTLTMRLKKIFRSNQKYFDQKTAKIEKLREEVQRHSNELEKINFKTNHYDMEDSSKSKTKTAAIEKLNKSIKKHQDLIQKNTPFISTAPPHKESEIMKTKEIVGAAKAYNKRNAPNPRNIPTKQNRNFFEIQVLGKITRES